MGGQQPTAQRTPSDPVSRDAVRGLSDLLDATLVDMQRVAELLDSLPNVARIRAVRALGRSEQRNLWNAAEGFREIALEHLVPAGTPPLHEVRHYGRNSLPAFTLFEKRFYRTGAGDAAFGANFQLMSPLTGPGYFSVSERPDRRELLIDYGVLPTLAPEGWPAITPNERGFSRLVYGFLTDSLRAVSEHVSVGMPARNGRPLGSWFVLCREAAGS